MRVIIKKNYDDCSIWVANYVADKINAAKPTAAKPFVIGLPTGSTPVGVYRELVKLCKAGAVSFENVVSFNMDEYVGLPHEHPCSYWHFMHDNFFNHIDIKPENINILDGMAADLSKECADYEQKIKNIGGIDLFLGGIGENGHIAFNEPGTSLSSRTRIKRLTKETREANARFFDGDLEQVPRLALTVGVGTIMDAREILIMASGRHKAEALRQTVEGGVSHMCTASVLQMHQYAAIVCDDDAAGEFSSRIVDYFKDIEYSELDFD
ncbi:MAG: glucosamine-6-phosphate deaminase [Alphaproteobacteria bacterium]|nr:glucosamine-6-phosphate deaminase [Alphaproteobacteria bacterium]